MNQPSFPNLITVPYANERIEYAWEVRETISRYKDKSPIIVVDLPEGYNTQVIQAVKRLPAISCLIDPLKRGIAIHPGHPAIEAVRSFLDWGLDLYFIDTCFPCYGSGDNWNRFRSYCARFGFSYTLEHAEEYDIDVPALIGLNKPEFLPKHKVFFSDNPLFGQKVDDTWINDGQSSYFASRQRYMAARLRSILTGADVPVIFVCHRMHLSSVMRYFKEDVSAPVMQVHIPVTVCRLRERSISLITDEIPYFIYMYELFRDRKPDKGDWIRRLCCEAAKEEKPTSMMAMIEYAGKLALAEGKWYTDLVDLHQASRSCCTPEYCRRFLDQALKYPLADPNPDCEIIPVMDLNHVRFKTVQFIDRIYSSLSLNPPKKEKEDRVNTGLTFSFNRTRSSLADEREWMRYLQERFSYLLPGDEHHSLPFVSGLAGGVDFRDTIRYGKTGEIYVREPDALNHAVFVFYFGGDPNWQFYCDRQHLMTGTARREGNRFTLTSLVAFSHPVPIMKVFQDIRIWSPLESVISAALSYGRKVFLFSDEKPDFEWFSKHLHRIQWVCLQKIPDAMQEKIQVFYVT